MVAGDGEEALDLLLGDGPSSFAAREILPAMILLDLNLPKVDAHEVLRKIRASERRRMLPVVILTSSDEEKDLIESYSPGCNRYVRKPVEFDTFVEATRQMILNGVPLRRILERIAKYAANLSGIGSRCAIMLSIPKNEHLVLGAESGFEEGFFDSLHPFPIGEGLGPCAAAAALGKMVVFEDIERCSDSLSFRDASRQAGLRACWSVPVFSSDRSILATLGIYHREPGSPSPEEVRWMESASQLASLAIERSRAAEQLKASEALLRIASEATHCGGWNPPRQRTPSPRAAQRPDRPDRPHPRNPAGDPAHRGCFAPDHRNNGQNPRGRSRGHLAFHGRSQKHRVSRLV